PSSADLADVYLYTVDDLHAVIEENLESRRLAARQADEIIAIETERFMEWLQSLDAVTTIQALRERASIAREQVLRKGLQQLAKGEDPVQVIESLTTSLINKLTHMPSVKLREASAAGRDELLRAAQELFDLGNPPTPAPSSLLKDGSSTFPSPRALPRCQGEGETPAPSLPLRKGEGEGGGVLPEIKK
ncbi:MAG TPA: hypothetical protein VE965_04295, partial [Gammaproteobacteria bacterium]|nr:hypothetical protein [Gammaproteobacteria bacterium]